MVREAGAGEIAESGSAAALADALRALAERPVSERMAMGRAGRDWVVAERDRPVLARKLDAVLRPLLATA
jgi:glycosyltransferase involved in cell wall biosynthesis